MASFGDGASVAVVSAVVGYGSKYAQVRWAERRADRRAAQDVWAEDRRTVYLPLMSAARELQERLERLARIYRGEPESFRPDSLSADFRELYLLSPEPISDLYRADANEPRRDPYAVQRLRTRMCRELNFATSTLYRAARYIAEAQSVGRRMEEGRHHLPGGAARELRDRIVGVSAALQGGGAGIAVEQQDSIGEMMRTDAGRIITQFEFRQRLLVLPGWEQYTALMTFFITEDDDVDARPYAARLAAKVDHEVGGTIAALVALVASLDRLTDEPEPASGRGGGRAVAT